MSYIDTRTYFQHDMWKRQGKSFKWLNGYDAGFNGNQLPFTASIEYKDGYKIGFKDRQSEAIPPNIKSGFGYGHGFKPDVQD